MTDTNRLARARYFIGHDSGVMRMCMDVSVDVEWLAGKLALFAEREVKAAVEWVDCQDRQPTEMEMHSITHLDGDTLKVTTLFWNPYYSAWMYQGKPTTMKVIAWLPKPQPYQPKENQDA